VLIRGRTAVFVLAFVVASTIPAGAALCRAKKGVLLLRDQCRRGQDEVVDIGTPRVVDAAGKEVGLLVSLEFLVDATVLRKVELPGETRSQWMVLEVTPDGFEPRSTDDALIRFVYATPDCTGSRYLSADDYSVIALSTFARPLFREPGKTGGVFARREELVTQQYYGKFELQVPSGADPAQACTNRNGLPPAVLLQGPRACSYNAEATCVTCCGPSYGGLADEPSVGAGAPAHEFDPATLGLTPPFSLSR
jgi:hypothetical protein